MEKVRHVPASPVVKKGKKKQAKVELDRLKQAEKKKRRLEKALATSAAIRSELEKKKQKKMEEQQRLDEEAAAIAEAVALHVLIGDDKDDSNNFLLGNNRKYNSWNDSSNIDLFMGYQRLARYSVDGLGWASDAYGHEWKDWGNKDPLAPHRRLKGLQAPYYTETIQGADISGGLIAAQALAALKIAEDPAGTRARLYGQDATTVVINQMLGGSNSVNKLNFYREL